MKTKVVYAVVSSECDYFIEQLKLSIVSLRSHNSEVTVELVVDEDTYNGLQGTRLSIKEMVNNIHVVKCPIEYTSVQKSRFLKTNIRSTVEGTFLFLDCDTLICDSLDDIDNCDFDISMVADLNGPLLLQDVNTIQKYARAGFGDATGVPYFNSGVIFSKDNLKTHNFFDSWKKNLAVSFEHGVMYDQPALCATNEKLGRMINELSGVWNCQYKMYGMRFLNNAKILHYYSNNGINYLQNNNMHFLLNTVKSQVVLSAPVCEILRNAKTKFYALTTITIEQQLNLLNSPMLWLLSNRPRVFGLVVKLASFLETFFYNKK